jgi:hypothetical protein
LGPRKKTKADYEERMDSIKKGREGRDKFGSLKGKKRKEAPSSSTNREKSKNKPIMMALQYVSYCYREIQADITARTGLGARRRLLCVINRYVDELGIGLISDRSSSLYRQAKEAEELVIVTPWEFTCRFFVLPVHAITYPERSSSLWRIATVIVSASFLGGYIRMYGNGWEK